jgi:hypothetical protein
MKRIISAASCLALGLWLSGCSTLSGDFHQKLQIDALDAQNRPIEGMQCQVGSGSSAQTVVTPAADVRVRRSSLSLAIDCHRDSLVATATVKPRRERMEEALLPFGSAGVFVDHFSGALYSYPTTLHLRLGQHLVLEHGSEAQVAKSEPIDLARPSAAPAPQRIQLAAADPAAVGAGMIGSTASASSAAAAAQKARAVASTRTIAKPIKTVATAGTAAKPRAVASAAPARSAPVNW